jgi:hypothetical protein
MDRREQTPLSYSCDVSTLAIATAASSSSAIRTPGYSSEFRCMLACLRWPLDAVAIDQIRATAQTVTDWAHFVAIVQRHRVAGLVSNAVAKAGVTLPAGDGGTLRQVAGEQTRQSMLHTAETIRVDRLLRSHGVEPVFLKGSTLTLLAYGRLDLRHAKDVDVLVPEADAPRAIEALHAGGYVPMLHGGPLTPEQMQRWLHYGKSMDWRQNATGAILELHWKMSDLPLLQGALTSDRQQRVTLAGGASVITLDSDHLFAYLCVHGASHGWSRLKWLADVYAMLPHDDAAATETLYRRALALGAGRGAGQALLLCDALLGLSLSKAFRDELQRDTVLRLLTLNALRLLARGNETVEIYDLSFGTSSVYLSRFLLGNGVRATGAELVTLLFPVEQTALSRLPRSMLFLFPVVRASSWIANRLRHGGRSNQP